MPWKPARYSNQEETSVRRSVAALRGKSHFSLFLSFVLLGALRLNQVGKRPTRHLAFKVDEEKKRVFDFSDAFLLRILLRLKEYHRS
jgi:hypothetical protein